MTFDYPLVFFYTRDLARTASFYEGTLGLTLVRDQGACRIYRVGASGVIGFCERASTPAQPEGEPVGLPTGVILTLVAADVDGWHDRLRAADVPIEHPPKHNPAYQIYHFFFRDPNGYLLEIQRFDTPLEVTAPSD